MDEIKELKEKLSKTNQLLDKLDEKLARSKINKARYEATSAQPGVFT